MRGPRTRATSSRPGAQQEVAKGLGFDADREDIDMIATVRAWEKTDELMWRFIVSPEDADRLNLRDHVRELVGQMERDLGTKLEWVAIDHHNTDDAHVHLLVRGVRENGRTLKINREYLRSGFVSGARRSRRGNSDRASNPRCCMRASALSAASNGPRSTARSSTRPTPIASSAMSSSSRAATERGFAPSRRSIGCTFSQGSDSRSRVDERSWQLPENHERELRDRQQSNDVIKSRAHSRQRAIDTGMDRVRERERERNG